MFEVQDKFPLAPLMFDLNINETPHHHYSSAKHRPVTLDETLFQTESESSSTVSRKPILDKT